MPRAGAGDYRERIVVLRRVLESPDGTGEEVETWAEPAPGTGQHYGKIEAVSGSESLEATRASFTALTLRFRHAVTLDAVDRVRVKSSGVEYAVSGVHQERAPWGGMQTVCTLGG